MLHSVQQPNRADAIQLVFVRALACNMVHIELANQVLIVVVPHRCAIGDIPQVGGLRRGFDIQGEHFAVSGGDFGIICPEDFHVVHIFPAVRHNRGEGVHGQVLPDKGNGLHGRHGADIGILKNIHRVRQGSHIDCIF